ncbi:unnamed protein product [Peniophora sp. CBMAI 1063]|nr:unnamed protein product [Peniophora sp. CBMAI 1063]
MRYASGCTVPGDFDRSLELAREVSEAEGVRPWEVNIHAAAERLNAWIMFYMMYCGEDIDQGSKLDMLYWGARRIGRALWIERVANGNKPPQTPCPIDLRIAEAIAFHLDRDDYLGRQHDPSGDERLHEFKLVWLDYTVRAQVRLRYGTRAKVCARAGCGGRGTDENSLKRCSGKCPLQHKPVYCSRQCQITGWKAHKKYCVEGAGGLPEKTTKRGMFDTAQFVPLSALKKRSL